MCRCSKAQPQTGDLCLVPLHPVCGRLIRTTSVLPRAFLTSPLRWAFCLSSLFTLPSLFILFIYYLLSAPFLLFLSCPTHLSTFLTVIHATPINAAPRSPVFVLEGTSAPPALHVRNSKAAEKTWRRLLANFRLLVRGLYPRRSAGAPRLLGGISFGGSRLLQVCRRWRHNLRASGFGHPGLCFRQ